MSAADLLLEALGIISAVICLGLQIFHVVSYGAKVMNLFINILTLLLVHAGLTLLQCCPEKVNGLTPQICTGKIRMYTIRMVRFAKLIFVEGLLFTSICDAMGVTLNQGYSLVVVVLIVVVAVYYEYKIIKILRKK